MCGPRPTSGFAVTQLIVSVIARLFPPPPTTNTTADAHYWRDSSLLYNSSDYYHNLMEAGKFAYALRPLLGDPRFEKEVDALVEEMTTESYSQRIVEKIRKAGERAVSEAKAYGADEDVQAVDDKGTSHVSVVDADGNAMALTSSVNYM